MPAANAPVTLYGLRSTVIVERGECVNTNWNPNWQSLVDDGYFLVYDPPQLCANINAALASTDSPPTNLDSMKEFANALGNDPQFYKRVNNIQGTGFTPQSFLKWNKALHNVRAGTADARILCIGDSTTFGMGAGTDTKTSYPAWLAKRLNSIGLAPSAAGLGIAANGNSVVPDTRWTATNWNGAGGFGAIDYFGWTPGPVPLGYWCSNTTGATLTFNPGVLADTYDVYYFDNTGFTGTMSIQATGGAVTNIAAGSTAQTTQKVTVTAASVSASNTVTITKTGGDTHNCWVFAIEPRRSDIKQVLVGNAGVSGSSTIGWNGTSGFLLPNQTPRKMIENYAPHLTIIDLGLNDAVAGTASSQNYQTNLQNLINSAKLSGDVILKTFTPAASGFASQANQDTYLAIIRGMGVPVVDVNQRMMDAGGHAVYSAAGYYADTAHSTSYGYEQEASWLAETLRLV